MSDKPILYQNILSPPCRAVLLVGAELGIEFELKYIDLIGFEHMGEEFVKINPQHTVPTLVHNGFMIADSHAICAYLSEVFGETDRLYPKDLRKRALVDSRLHFDSGHVFCRMRFLYEPILYMKSKEMPEDRIKYIQMVYPILESFLENSPYMCGDEITIADFCLVATVSSCSENAPIDEEACPNLLAWIDRMAELPYYDESNANGAKDLQAGVRAMLKQNQELE